MINSGSELNKIIYLILILLFGCNSLPNSENKSKIKVSPEVKKRVQELINNNIIEAAEVFNKPSSNKAFERNFVSLILHTPELILEMFGIQILYTKDSLVILLLQLVLQLVTIIMMGCRIFFYQGNKTEEGYTAILVDLGSRT